MDREHWFDALNKVLVQDAPRRGILRQACAAAFGAVIGSSLTGDAAKKRKKKRKSKPKKKRHKKPPRQAPQSCTAGACDREFSTPDDRDYCEFICRQCDGDDPRQFCIVEGDPTDPAKVAVCCAEGAECCGNSCCGGPQQPGRHCCDGKCINTNSNDAHCGGCDQPCSADKHCVNGSCVDRCADSQDVCCGISCGVERMCCPDASNAIGGFKCAHLPSDRDHCGACGNGCPPYPWACCYGTCVDLSRDNDHCGFCNLACRPPQTCVPNGDHGFCTNP
jgi:hypothetical protein